MMKLVKKIIIILLPIVFVASFVLLVIKNGSSTKTAYHQSKDFTANVLEERGSPKVQFARGGSQVEFTLIGQNAKKVSEDTFEIGKNVIIDYEIIADEKEKGLKETITLKNSEAPKKYSFDLTLKDVKNFAPNPIDNSWRFYNREGREVFYIPQGFMIDAKGQRSEQVGIGISQNDKSYTLEVTADEVWLNNQNRAYPVKIDPSVIVSGTIAETEAQFGGLQKKVVYVNSNWYAFYTDGTDVFYKKSSNGADWGSAVDMDSTDADNLNPTTWVEGNLIYVAWIDDGTDNIEVNTINTASSDALGTKCTSADQGTIADTFTVALTVVDDGTVYFAYSDTSTDTEAAVFKLVFSGCTFTDISTGSGLTAGDRPVLTSRGAEAHMIFQDGNLSTSVYDGAAWINSNGDIGQVVDNIYDVATDGKTIFVLTVSGSSTVNLYSYASFAAFSDIDTDVGLGKTSIYCPATDDCKVAYFDQVDQDVTFADCNDAACSAPTINDIDTAVSTNGKTSIYCPAADDCKVAYADSLDNDITFADCNDASCSAPTITDIDTEAPNAQVSIYCPSATDCKVAYFDGTDDDVTFADCNDAACSAPTITDIDTNSTSGSPSIYCPSATDCKVAYVDGTDDDVTFADCNDAACSAPTITDIDTDVGISGQASIYCPTADDCKVAYADSSDLDITFADCNDASCSAPTITDIDADVGSGHAFIYCPSATDCKVAYFDGTDIDITFADCNDAACSAPTITDIDTDVSTSALVSIYCPSATDCKVAYYDGTDADITFADCNDAACTVLAEPPTINIDTDAGGFTEPSIYCPAADDCKVAYADDTDADITFADCNDAACSAPTITDIDTDAGSTGQPSVYCPSATDCKVAYVDDADFDITFADCNDASCSAPTITDIDTDVSTSALVSIYCPSATDCKVAYNDGTDADITFADCNDASCSAPTITDIDTDVGTFAMPSIYCPAADDCKVAYADITDQDITFADCNDAACSAPTITDIDTDAGSTGQASIYCPSATDCKVAYVDDADFDITFADCNDAACSAPTITDIDTDVGGFSESYIYCPSATDCKVAYGDLTDQDITFADCNDAACSAPTITDIDTNTSSFGIPSIFCPAADDCKVAYFDDLYNRITFADCNDATCTSITSFNAPWNGQTNLTSVAATYTDMKLYSAAIMDSSEQAYWRVTSTNSISWSAATSFAFTAGDLGQIAIYFTDTDEIEAVLRQSTNLEFSDQNKKKSTFKNKVTIKNKVTVK